MLIQEFDTLSEKIKTEITNKTEISFAKVTADNILRSLYILVEASNYDRVQIAQDEVAIQLNLSQNRVSELLKLAKKAGLIATDMICRCGDVRNEYTLLDNPIVNSIKKIVFKSTIADSKESIELAIDNAMSFYRLSGEQEHVLQEVKRRIPIKDFKRASGVFGYFKKALRTVKRILEPESTTPHNKKKQGNFNNYEQRPFDPSLEDKLLGIVPVEEKIEEYTDTQAFLNRLRE